MTSTTSFNIVFLKAHFLSDIWYLVSTTVYGSNSSNIFDVTVPRGYRFNTPPANLNIHSVSKEIAN